MIAPDGAVHRGEEQNVMLNVLTEPVIRFDRFDRTKGRTGNTLPEVYAAMMTNSVLAFTALRPHQRHAWHAFLAQLGAMAMHRAGAGAPPETAPEWLKLLRGLTPNHPRDEPWQMVVNDVTRPAFMQPPAQSDERERDYRNTAGTPDEIDILVTSKNHDLKLAVAVHAEADDWILALVTLQTMEGFSGAGSFGISRMNSGFGNRPAFTLGPSDGPGTHLKRDILALLERRDAILDNHPMKPDGIGLLWTVPWDGAKDEALMPEELDPLYIEVCREAVRAGGVTGEVGPAVRGLPRPAAADYERPVCGAGPVPSHSQPRTGLPGAGQGEPADGAVRPGGGVCRSGTGRA